MVRQMTKPYRRRAYLRIRSGRLVNSCTRGDQRIPSGQKRDQCTRRARRREEVAH